ncbi:hypothetical protein C2845_PM15G03230 [Panicum miliaceum]|uniref:Uncharacterized protein n=1 Tax=Panicum miliaceum TaxID=4540 RepID=A0A3L6Q775_PANMI|nr:hypothetical protein C2845_PM15G03230 [Panicum miliaceum]
MLFHRTQLCVGLDADRPAWSSAARFLQSELRRSPQQPSPSARAARPQPPRPHCRISLVVSGRKRREKSTGTARGLRQVRAPGRAAAGCSRRARQGRIGIGGAAGRGRRWSCELVLHAQRERRRGACPVAVRRPSLHSLHAGKGGEGGDRSAYSKEEEGHDRCSRQAQSCGVPRG